MIGNRIFGTIACGMALAGAAGPSVAQSADISGELVIMNWLPGPDGATFDRIERSFEEKYPDVTVRDIVLSGAGDARGAIRAALLAGETADLLVNTWPAFRAELAEAGLLREIDSAWEAHGIGDNLSDSWKALGQTEGVTYGVQYTYGDRSGVWYRPDTLAAAGLDGPPETFDELVASFGPLLANGVTPFSIGAKVWSHGEMFETLLLRTAGVDTAAALAAHEIAWTDPRVRNVLEIWQGMIEAGCCGDPENMLANDWDTASDAVLVSGEAAYVIMGMWINGRARDEFGLEEGVDYALFQFPALGQGFDNTSSVDAKEVLALSSGDNADAANAFLAHLASAEAANAVAAGGLASPSSAVDTSIYGPVTNTATAAVAQSEVQFVLGDLLPGDLVDEYRVQLQRFLVDPSDSNIDAVLAAIEAKARQFD
ncbi:MAG: ABC transporter substrate-binding protein [Rhodobacter sp.]|nr:ABC transporter substrate-binding protein [Rhodobacter sp.]MCY4167538.1 ABC transporter substrate-binding protein [Rhodobacter sp.]MCY4241629.1 ABC transporter substrate-binding protein [Rhodobacter sp.]